jgi:hypothetical protein
MNEIKRDVVVRQVSQGVVVIYPRAKQADEPAGAKQMLRAAA